MYIHIKMKTTYVFVFVVFQDVGAPDPNIWQAKWHLLPRSSVLKMKMRPNLATTFLHSSKKTEKISETCIEIKIHQIMNSVASFRCWLLIFLVFWMFVKLEMLLVEILSCYLNVCASYEQVCYYFYMIVYFLYCK